MAQLYDFKERNARIRSQQLNDFLALAKLATDVSQKNRELQQQEALSPFNTGQPNQPTAPSQGILSRLPLIGQIFGGGQPSQSVLQQAQAATTPQAPQAPNMINTRFGPMQVTGMTPTASGGYMPTLQSVQADVNKEQAKKAAGATEQAKGAKQFLKQFERSYSELKKFDPKIGELGPMGYARRFGAKIASNLDSLPETKALRTELKPLANQMARDVEGGRVTDQDRSVYADSFANAVENPSETNIRLASNALIRMADLGGDISPVLNTLASSNTDIMQSIVQNVLSEYPDLAPQGYYQQQANLREQYNQLRASGMSVSDAKKRLGL